jgi:glycosyltransferase involved in cell wall biosynthesis
MINMKEQQLPLVSIIIPVWNPGPSISRCIESLQNQTLKEIEMIFVDDCGTDDSMDKVRAAAKEDSRIRIIENEENIGSGPSRNRGIEEARGEYLSFVDADDYVATDFLELLYTEAHAHALDIVKGCVAYIKEDGSEFMRDRELNSSIHNGLSKNRSLYVLFTYEHPSAIYRRDFLISNKIGYGASTRAQDNTFLLMACFQANSFSIIDSACYYYCARPSSALHTMEKTQLQGYLQAISEQFDYVLNNIPLDEESDSFFQRLILGGLREYSRYEHLHETGDIAQNYLTGLRKQMERANLPVDTSFPLCVLRDYGEALSPRPYYSPWEGNNPPIRYAVLAERWMDFYFNTSREKRGCWKELRKLLIAANKAVNGKPYSTYTKEEQKQGRALLGYQIKRLPLKLRLHLELLFVKDNAKQIIGRRLGK